MRKTFLILSVAVIAITAVVAACSGAAGSEEPKAAVKDSAWFVKRGDYLVNSIGCDDCHSPKQMGAHGPEVIPELRLSGFRQNGVLPPADTATIRNGWSMFSPDFTATAGGWGVSFAANLTSDETGIGNWSEQQFLTAIRKGKFKGMENGRDLLPPMPWFVYRNLTDDDLKAIFAYLKTTKPVANVVPAPRTLADLK